MSKQHWTFTEDLVQPTNFVEIDFPVKKYNYPSQLNTIDIRPAYLDSGWIYTPSDMEEVELLHGGDGESVIKAIRAEFGVTLEPRPDLGPLVFEIVDGV